MELKRLGSKAVGLTFDVVLYFINDVGHFQVAKEISIYD